VIGGIEAPKVVAGVKATDAPRTYHVDPTLTVDRDIRNAEGALLFARGTKVNPFDHVSLTRNLLFFDGRDSRQVAFAKLRLGEGEREEQTDPGGRRTPETDAGLEAGGVLRPGWIVGSATGDSPSAGDRQPGRQEIADR
jgi:hypothetical protein